MKTLEQKRQEMLFQFLFDNGIEYTEIYSKAKDTIFLFEDYNLYDPEFKKEIDDAIAPFKMILITGDKKSGKSVLLKHMADKFTRKISAIKDLADIDEMQVFDYNNLDMSQIQKYNAIAIDNVSSMQDFNKLMSKFNISHSPKTLFVVGFPQMKLLRIWNHHIKINKSKWGNYDGQDTL